MKWEYTQLTVHTGLIFEIDGQVNVALKGRSPVEVLNHLGEQGWELVAVCSQVAFYFKRAK
jgi:hypothetical protein